MKAKQSRENAASGTSPFKLLLWTAIVGLIFGVIGFGEFVEDALRVGRNSVHPHAARGDTVLIAVDDRSLQDLGNWPWPRSTHARIVDRLTQMGAKRIFYDLNFSFKSDPAEDAAFAAALARSGKVTLPAQFLVGSLEGKESKLRPLPQFRNHVDVATISVNYNYQNSAWFIPYSWKVDGAAVPSFSARLANVLGTPGQSFRVDYSLDPDTIPTFGASDVLSGRVSPSQFAGKDVVIGITAGQLGDQYFIPGRGKMGGVYIHLFGAETLKSGIPLDLGWFVAFALALAAATAGAFRRNVTQQNLIFGTTVTVLLVGPYLLEAEHIFVDVTPGLFVVLCVAASIGWRRFRLRGVVNAISGLPNLNALRADRGARDRPLIVTRVHNYAEIASTLPPEDERLFVDQIVNRLSVGSPNRTLYQGDEGIFAWFADSEVSMGDHLEALHSLFRNPARLGPVQIDLAVSFGVESGSGRSLANRIGSALVAADEAATEGLKWKRYDPEKLKDVTWKLSLLSQLDAAIESGEVWVAYQPKLDLNSQTICGAEALARWTHPEKGPISPMEFVTAAEQHDRIEKLTYFVLDQAIACAAPVNAHGTPFNIAVNLSARLLVDRNFPVRVLDLLKKYGLTPNRLTLELTETAALAGTGADLAVLFGLRDLGIKISIDDYGTGLSTLDYLKKIPASEIKIDQSFVKAIRDNRSDWLMVQSTIALAHSLGQTVVAEGVEDRLTLDALATMKCDVAQGFVIGRPTSFRSLMKRIQSDKNRAVA
jgi:EAL domain-containing protein (putative c-di-GMP-specific phosphodiesterase class I)/CHASE2 domain-containing sensor protein